MLLGWYDTTGAAGRPDRRVSGLTSVLSNSSRSNTSALNNFSYTHKTHQGLVRVSKSLDIVM